jgi:hypothetical protein
VALMTIAHAGLRHGLARINFWKATPDVRNICRGTIWRLRRRSNAWGLPPSGQLESRDSGSSSQRAKRADGSLLNCQKCGKAHAGRYSTTPRHSTRPMNYDTISHRDGAFGLDELSAWIGRYTTRRVADYHSAVAELDKAITVRQGPGVAEIATFA